LGEGVLNTEDLSTPILEEVEDKMRKLMYRYNSISRGFVEVSTVLDDLEEICDTIKYSTSKQ
jgi:hypothetical protein